jgi:hypothetical protein
VIKLQSAKNNLWGWAKRAGGLLTQREMEGCWRDSPPALFAHSQRIWGESPGTEPQRVRTGAAADRGTGQTNICVADPQVLPEYQTSVPTLNNVQGLRQILASPPEGGYVAIVKDLIVLPEVWHDLCVTTMDSISCSEDFRHSFQIEGARWHFLKLSLVIAWGRTRSFHQCGG